MKPASSSHRWRSARRGVSRTRVVMPKMIAASDPSRKHKAHRRASGGGLIAAGRSLLDRGDRLGLAVVLERELVHLAQVDVFPGHLGVALVEDHLDVLLAGGAVAELEEARLVVVEGRVVA